MSRRITSNYPAFKPIPRLHRTVTITEKIDGTNGVIGIEEKPFGSALEWEDNPDPTVIGYRMGAEMDESGVPEFEYWIRAGSRTRWISLKDDNHGFGKWVFDNGASLLADLGPGIHYGEWWGSKINRGYGLRNGERHFSLFNSFRWGKQSFATPGLNVVPVLGMSDGSNLNVLVTNALRHLEEFGSLASVGFMRPEGVVVYHDAAKQYFKATIEDDVIPKSLRENRDAQLLGWTG